MGFRVPVFARDGAGDLPNHTEQPAHRLENLLVLPRIRRRAPWRRRLAIVAVHRGIGARGKNLRQQGQRHVDIQPQDRRFHRQRYIREIFQPGNARFLVHHDAARTILDRRHQRHHVGPLRACRKQIIGVGHAKLRFPRGHAWNHRNARPSRQKFHLQARRLVIFQRFRLEISAMFRLRKPIQLELYFFDRRRRS